MRYIDSHCHLDFECLTETLESLLLACQTEGIERFVVPGVEVDRWPRLCSLANRFPQISIALGMHPCFIDAHPDDGLDRLDKALGSRRQVIAVGEIGLDRSAPFWARQVTLFEGQVELAVKHSLPIIVHSRKAHSDVLAILKRQKYTGCGVLHGFSGSVQDGMQFVKRGFYLGVGGVITYPRASKTRNAIARLPLSSLVLETDSPDMPPFGHQGEVNTPLSIKQVFHCLCHLRKEPVQLLQASLLTNTYRLFSLV